MARCAFGVHLCSPFLFLPAVVLDPALTVYFLSRIPDH